MSVSLHDTHFHLDLFDNPTQVLDRIERDEIFTIAVTNVPAVFEHTFKLAEKSKYVRAALGFHPELAARHKQQLSLFLELLQKTRYIGEIGLDNYKKSDADYATQIKIFEQLIYACDRAGKKIISAHSRRAEMDLISIIGPRFSGKVILHWYSGGLKEIDTALSYGFYFSVNFAMIQSGNGRKIISRLPMERILLETDGPFIKIGNQPSTPSEVYFTIKEIAKIKHQKNTVEIVTKNFRDLFL